MWRNRDSLQHMTDSFHRSRDNSIEYKDSTREAAMLSGRQKVGLNYSYKWRIRKFGKKRNKWKNYNTCNIKNYQILFNSQMIKMLIVVVVCFTICWFPLEVYWVLKYPFPFLSNHKINPYLFTLFHMLALSHACFNPIICCWMNSSVRYGFMSKLGMR